MLACCIVHDAHETKVGLAFSLRNCDRVTTTAGTTRSKVDGYFVQPRAVLSLLLSVWRV